jgi:hypothetical protein
VDVVGHNTPRQQPIALAIKVEQRLLDKLADAPVAQPTGAMALVFVSCNTFAQL